MSHESSLFLVKRFIENQCEKYIIVWKGFQVFSLINLVGSRYPLQESRMLSSNDTEKRKTMTKHSKRYIVYIQGRPNQMKSVKIHKVGSSNVLTVPHEIHPKYDTFDVFEGRDGAIIYLPKKSNPFTDPKYIAAHSGSELDEGFEVDADEFE